MQSFLETLTKLTTCKDRHIKGHSLALLKRLQELNPQDEEETTFDEFKSRQYNP